MNQFINLKINYLNRIPAEASENYLNSNNDSANYYFLKLRFELLSFFNTFFLSVSF